MILTTALEHGVVQGVETLALEACGKLAGGGDLSGVLLLLHHLRQPHQLAVTHKRVRVQPPAVCEAGMWVT